MLISYSQIVMFAEYPSYLNVGDYFSTPNPTLPQTPIPPKPTELPIPTPIPTPNLDQTIMKIERAIQKRPKTASEYSSVKANVSQQLEALNSANVSSVHLEPMKKMKPYIVKLYAGRHLTEAMFLAIYANVLEQSWKFKEAIECYEESLLILSRLGNKFGEAGTFTKLGIANSHLGLFDKSIVMFEKALGIFRALKRADEISITTYNIANTYVCCSNWTKAMETILTIDQTAGEIYFKAQLLLAMCYENTEQLETALTICNQLFLSSSPVVNSFQLLDVRASLLSKLGKLEQLEHNFEVELSHCGASNRLKIITQARYSFALVNLNKSRSFQLAESLYNEVVQLDMSDISSVLAFRPLGLVFTKFGNWRKAETLLKMNLDIRMKFHQDADHPLLAEAEQDLAELWYAQNDYSTTFIYASRCLKRRKASMHPNSREIKVASELLGNFWKKISEIIL